MKAWQLFLLLAILGMTAYNGYVMGRLTSNYERWYREDVAFQQWSTHALELQDNVNDALSNELTITEDKLKLIAGVPQ
jgi:hypothetical protein